MGICESELPDGSICQKKTVWNDMCEDCLDVYENGEISDEITLQEIIDVINSEEELPGDMPMYLFKDASSSSERMTVYLRKAVILTKKNIIKKLKERYAD